MSSSAPLRSPGLRCFAGLLILRLLISLPLSAAENPSTPPATEPKKDEETLVLSGCIFGPAAPEDTGYVAVETLAGNRIRTDLHIARVYISVVNKQNLEDLALSTQENVLSYLIEPQQNPALARVSANSGLLDSLPIATLVDPATIEQIYIPTNNTSLSAIAQRRANNRNTDKITLRVGDQGYLAGTVESSFQLAGRKSSPSLAIFSWQQFQQAQWSAFLEIRHDLGARQYRGNIQARSLGGYGDMRLVHLSYDRAIDDRFWLQATLAWHRLHRADPRQFQLGLPSAQFDNLGFFNLDLLTANTGGLEDQIASLGLAWEQAPSPLRSKLSVRSIWHRQKADWIDTAAAIRTDLLTKFTWQVYNPNNRFSSNLDYELVHHTEAGLIEPNQWTHDISLGLNLNITEPVRLFLNLGRHEILPFVPTGLIQNATSTPHPVSQLIEQREIKQAGLNLDFFYGKLTGNVALFHETIRNHSFRDWAWEGDHATTGVVVRHEGLLHLPVSYATASEWQREGWMGEINWMPKINALSCRVTWYCDWKNDGPYRGGNRQASFVSSYTFHSGLLRGFTGGFAVSTRNTMTFNDGYQLRGGTRWDILFAYEHKLSGGHNQKFQLNLMNLTDCPWQPTRFAKDHGRQVLLSVSREF